MTDIDEHLETIDWENQQESGEVLLSPAWEVFILGVSLLSVFNLVFVIFIRNPHIDQVIFIMDAVLTLIFLADLVRRMIVADDIKRYFVKGYGWIDFLAAFPVLRILRLLRIVRMVRLLQRLGGPIRAFRAFFSNKAAGGLLTVLLIALLVMEFGALAILAVERGQEGANIETATDAVWYLLVTMSTVGYGDQFPVTDAGRLIGSLIIVVGVGVFGTLTGYIANIFLAPDRIEDAQPIAEVPADGLTTEGAGSEGDTSSA